jgi:hypothetical protein
VIFEKLQTGRGVRAVLENFSAILGLFQKREVRPEGKFRGVRRKAPTSKHQAPEKHQAPNTQLPSRSIWSLEVGISLELGGWSLELFHFHIVQMEFGNLATTAHEFISTVLAMP